MDKKLKRLETQIQILAQQKQKLQQARIQRIGHVAMQAGLGPINDTTLYNAFTFIKRQIDEGSEIATVWKSHGQDT